MKLTVLQENFIKALNAASRIITSRAQMPILSHVKLDASQSGLVISATDLEIGLRLHVGAKVEQPGSVTVPARVITELINNCGPGSLQLSLNNYELSILGSHTRAKIAGMSPEEYPALPEFSDQQVLWELPTEQLVTAINKVAFSAAADDSRPVLTAIQVKLTADSLELTATDGFRLSWFSIPFPSSIGNLTQSTERSRSVEGSKLETRNSTWLIPARALQEITRLVDQGTKSIKLSFTEKSAQIIFHIPAGASGNDTDLISRLVSGDFPDIKKVTPDTGDIQIEVDRGELLRAMRLAAIFARESANIVKFDLSPSSKERAGGGTLKIAANAPQVGDQETTVETHHQGPAAQIAFNYRFVLDYLNCGHSPLVKLLMTNALGPGLWLESNPPSKQRTNETTKLQYKHVIMPVRVENT